MRGIAGAHFFSVVTKFGAPFGLLDRRGSQMMTRQWNERERNILQQPPRHPQIRNDP